VRAVAPSRSTVTAMRRQAPSRRWFVEV
jgi:hypothetical protein